MGAVQIQRPAQRKPYRVRVFQQTMSPGKGQQPRPVQRNTFEVIAHTVADAKEQAFVRANDPAATYAVANARGELEVHIFLSARPQ